jgi:2,3-bisphosphoglycerate-dependent phosphoglycerate mutase
MSPKGRRDDTNMQLYLIRHAESENNARPAYQRVEDPSITPVGRLQAEALAQWTRSMKIDVLVTSPFRRSLQTSRMVSEVSQPGEAMIWHDVFERGGCYLGYGNTNIQGRPGLGRSSIQTELPIAKIDDSITEAGWWAGKGKETDEETEHRAGAVIRRFVETFGPSGTSVIAVLHADFIRTMLAQMLHPTADANLFGPLRNTGITKVDFDGQRWRLDWLNSVSHLPHRLITGVEW